MSDKWLMFIQIIFPFMTWLFVSPDLVDPSFAGGNDNKLCIWSLKSTEPVLKFTQHQAAVKAGHGDRWYPVGFNGGHEKTMGNPLENHGKIGFGWENQGKMEVEPLVNLKKHGMDHKPWLEWW